MFDLIKIANFNSPESKAERESIRAGFLLLSSKDITLQFRIFKSPFEADNWELWHPQMQVPIGISVLLKILNNNTGLDFDIENHTDNFDKLIHPKYLPVGNLNLLDGYGTYAVVQTLEAEAKFILEPVEISVSHDFECGPGIVFRYDGYYPWTTRINRYGCEARVIKLFGMVEAEKCTCVIS